MNLKIAALGLLAISVSGCANISDAPKAGSEVFMPISNNAFYVKQGPYIDRFWLDRTAEEAQPGGPRNKGPGSPIYTK